MLIKRRGARRVVGAVMIVSGAVLLWLAPEVLPGVLLLAAGVALEIAGIALEHRDGARKG